MEKSIVKKPFGLCKKGRNNLVGMGNGSKVLSLRHFLSCKKESGRPVVSDDSFHVKRKGSFSYKLLQAG